MLTDQTSLADIEFRLEWKSTYAMHTDIYHAGRVNFYRDCFPGNLYSELLHRAPGDVVERDCPPGTMVAGFDPRNEMVIRPSQFHTSFDPVRITLPRAGRFYPKGILGGIANVFPANIQPFRVIEPGNSGIRISFNHPLSSFPLRFRATVEAVYEKPVDRGGTCIDWLETACTGPGMQVRAEDRPTDFFSDDPFLRDDESDDAVFYARPRMVNHLDDRAIEVIRDMHGQILRPGMRVLDLMSSWTSHLPESVALSEVVGLGMNREELAANPRISRFIVQDLNRDSALPFPDGSFDAVICTASVEYLIRPLEVFSEISRILKPTGVCAITFSNRWFPPKAIQIWKSIHEFERMGLVLEYLIRGGAFQGLQTVSVRGLPRPATDKYAGEQRYSDPIYQIRAEKAG